MQRLRHSGFTVSRIQEFANRRVIRALDLLFLPSAFWFLAAKVDIRLPLIGNFKILRGLVRKSLWSLYWRNQRGEGASYLLEAIRADVEPSDREDPGAVQAELLAHAVLDL
jgi:hypothetical protein